MMGEIHDYEHFTGLLKEGLIRTYDMRQQQSTLELKLDSCGITHRFGRVDKLSFDLILPQQNNLPEWASFANTWIEKVFGYFPSRFHVTRTGGRTRFFSYDKDTLEEELSKSSVTEVRIRYEAKYDDGQLRNDHPVPDFLYHLTPDSNVGKILKSGLIPRSEKRASAHPDRIYLFVDPMTEKSVLLRGLRANDLLKGITRTYSLVRVDLRKRKDVVLHTDPNYLPGFYTYDNIAPYTLEVVESGL